VRNGLTVGPVQPTPIDHVLFSVFHGRLFDRRPMLYQQRRDAAMPAKLG
jgi:hypothetical protein